MKLAIDCRMIGKSGIGTYIENILPYMLDHKEHKFLLIGDERQLDKYKELDNVNTLVTNIQPLSPKELFCFPTKEINKCDVFYSPYINIPLGIKIPIYSTIHDVIFLDVKGLTSKVGGWLRGLIYKIVAKKSKKVFTVSNFSKRRILHHLDVLDADVIVTYNGISQDLKDYVQHHPIPSSREDYFIFVGNVKKHKGLKTLIEAFKIAKKKDKGIELVIVGKYEAFKSKDEETVALIDSMKGNITFTGFVENSKLFDLISKAKALILPTHYEGFGIPPLEALYLGTDAIVTDIDVLKEVYGDLPVSFVKDNDAEALAEELLYFKPKNCNLCSLRESINNKYSFKKSAEIIFSVIQ